MANFDTDITQRKLYNHLICNKLMQLLLFMESTKLIMAPLASIEKLGNN